MTKICGSFFCIKNFKSVIEVNNEASLEYEHTKQNYLFSLIKKNAISIDTVIVLVQNVGSHSRHVKHIESETYGKSITAL